jgi:hypothetical protein
MARQAQLSAPLDLDKHEEQVVAEPKLGTPASFGGASLGASVVRGKRTRYIGIIA